MDSDEPKASQKRATAKQKSSKDDDVSDLV
jgi:hypothetical protein